MKIEDIIKMALMSESAFADKYEIPSETLFHWVTYDINHADPPKYVNSWCPISIVLYNDEWGIHSNSNIQVELAITYYDI